LLRSARRPAQCFLKTTFLSNKKNMLHEQIKNGIKEAMMAKDALRLKAFRAMSAAFTNELVAKNKKPQEMLTDEEVLVVITKLAKQRKDSIEQFKKGGREDLVKEEGDELAIFETYLPKLMDKAEVEKIAQAKKDELGITDATKKGMLMSALMKDLKGKADGMVVKEVVDSLF
jgi:hypothetical protein